MLAHRPRGFQEAAIHHQIFPVIGAVEFQGDVRVLFPLNKLSNGGHCFLLEGKPVLFLVSVEGRAVQDAHDHALGHLAQEQVVLHPSGGGHVEGKSTSLASHHRLLGPLLLDLSLAFQRRVDVRVETQSAQVKGDVHILFSQLYVPFDSGSTAEDTKGVEIRTVEVQLHFHFLPGHHDLARVEGGQVRLHDQADHVVAQERRGEGLERVRRTVSPVCLCANVVVGFPGCQRRGHVQEIDPALRRQQGLSIVAVEVEEGLNIGRVGVGVSLFAHQGPIELQIDLLKDGEGQVVDRVRELGVVGKRRRIGIHHDAIGGRRVQPQVNGEKTTIQIRVMLGVMLLLNLW